MWKHFLAEQSPSRLLVFLTALTCATAALGEAPLVEWSELVDQEAQVFDDPYADLQPDQLLRLVSVARLRARAEKGETIDEERLSTETASLTAEGIDIDDLIAQRWAVAERREHAATSGNKVMGGREVNLLGFLIPAPADADGVATAYLVPERSMCSHVSPPAPNQMVRLRLPNDRKPEAPNKPVRLSGQLEIAPSSRMVPVVDGLVPMNATFFMDVSEIETLGTGKVDEASHEHSHESPAARLSTND